MIFPMKTVKVDGSLVKDSGDSRLRHKKRLLPISKKRLLPIILVILFSVVEVFGYRWYIIDQANSEKFLNAHETIEQLSEKYGYVDKSSLIVEELLDADDDVIHDIRTKIRYLDRKDFSGEDYVKYTEVRDYYADILATPYMLTLLGTVLIVSSLMYIVYILIK